MKTNDEIKALFSLLDDPDELVFSSVSERILSFGKSIIPSLEDYWENANDEIIQNKIEDLIQKVNLNEVKDKLSVWEEKENASLIDSIILLSKYMYPNLDENEIHKTIKSIHSSCWLELNEYLTPLEEIHIINSIFYNMYKLSAERNAIKNPTAYYINEVLQRRSGNQYSLAMLYQLIAKMLDIPIFAMKVSNFVVLGYFDTIFDFSDLTKLPEHKTQFFIEPTEGTILSQQDVAAFIKKYEIDVTEESFKPIKNRDFLYYYLQSLRRAYETEQNEDKAADIQRLMDHIFPDWV